MQPPPAWHQNRSRSLAEAQARYPEPEAEGPAVQDCTDQGGDIQGKDDPARPDLSYPGNRYRNRITLKAEAI